MKEYAEGSSRQIVAVTMICGIFEQITWFPALGLLKHPYDLPMTVLLSAGIQALLLLPMWCILRKIQRITENGKAFSAWNGIYFFMAAETVLWCGYRFLSRTVMPQTSGIVVLSLVLLAGGYVAARETAAVVKTSAFFAAGSVLITILFLLFSASRVSMRDVAFLPQGEPKLWEAALSGALRGCTIPLLLMLTRHNTRDTARILCINWIGTFGLNFLIATVAVTTLGTVAQKVLFPVYMQAGTVRFGGVLQHMESIWVVGWSMAFLSAFSVLLHYGEQCFETVRNGGKYAFGVLTALGAIVICFAEEIIGVPNMPKGGEVLSCSAGAYGFFLAYLLLVLRKKRFRGTNTVQKGKK